MGASQGLDQIYSTLNQILKHTSNVLVVSDRDQDLGHVHAHDVLRNLDSWYSTNNPEFSHYNKINRANHISNSISSSEGWHLDKFKFLPMVEYAYQKHSTAEWFVFVETDTVLIWDNLLLLLGQYNHSQAIYMGSPTLGRPLPDGMPTWFVYGGSGFLLSQGAMTRVLLQAPSVEREQLPRLSDQFRTLVKEDCCGDSVLGYAISWKGIRLSGLFPAFNPHALYSLNFDAGNLCVPIVSLHKNIASDIPEFFDFLDKHDWKVRNI